MVVFFSVNLFAQGKITLEPSMQTATGRIEPKGALYIQEDLLGPIGYEQWSGAGVHPTAAEDVFWLVTKHDLYLNVGDDMKFFGGITGRWAKTDSQYLKDYLASDVHVGFSYKLW